MGIEYHISHVRTLRAGDETLSQARNRIPKDFPRRSARRMTHLGTLLARILTDPPAPIDGTVVYGTDYAETRSLEAYVDSFPQPSPLLFQASIHPSGVQQVFVHRRIPLDAFIPIAGNENLIGSLFDAAVLAGTDRVTICGGEEQGTWLLEQGKASDIAFAWTLTLSSLPDDSVGRLSIPPEALSATPAPVRHQRFLTALERHSSLSIPRAAGGAFHLDWR